MKNYEQGMKVLSPSIFRKSKGPLVLAASAVAGQFDSSAKPVAPASLLGKKPESLGGSKEFSLQDYDIKACFDLKDVHCKRFLIN